MSEGEVASTVGSSSTRYDVVVIGGGNAALVAAIAARHRTGSVLLVERAPQHARGGNSRHTRNIRCAHDQPDAFCPGVYPESELWADLCAVGSGPSDEHLAQLTVASSAELPAWMAAHGQRWQPPLTGTLHLSRTNRFFLGGGKALVNRYYATAERLGVTVAYESSVVDLVLSGTRCTEVVIERAGVRRSVAAGAVVCAAGGFEADVEWLVRNWGDGARNYVVRGTPYNDGTVLAMLRRHGVASAGSSTGFHAIAVDARAPRFDGGIATRIDAIPFGIVVNASGARFSDEGADLWPKRYASWGDLIAHQPGQTAYVLWDDAVTRQFLPPLYPPTVAGSIRQLAEGLGIDPDVLVATVDRYNAATVRGAPYDPGALDGCATVGLTPPKSNWARPLATPPFSAIALRTGVTFTYEGVAVDETARVRLIEGGRFENVFAAGEIMSGNVLSDAYLAGFGMTIGTVWGRIAGSGAAVEAHGVD